MANLTGTYDPGDAPAAPLEAIPSGKYTAMIVDSDFNKTKAGDGEYLKLKFMVTEGEYKGRHVYVNLNLKNKSDMAVQIARGEFSAIRHATGVLQPKDSVDLHNLPIIIKVACEKRNDTGELTNVIKGYEAKSTQTAAKAPAKAPTGRPAAAPWKKPAAQPAEQPVEQSVG